MDGPRQLILAKYIFFEEALMVAFSFFFYSYCDVICIAFYYFYYFYYFLIVC